MSINLNVHGLDDNDWAKNKKRLTITERVLRGARWLDKVRPNWFNEVDLGTLDLGSSCHCVLGQIVSYEAKRAEDGAYGDLSHLNDIEDTLYEMSNQGFDVVCDPSDYSMPVIEAVDDLKSICISTEKARERGFHTYSGELNEWHELTAAWRGLIEAYRA